MSGEQRLPAPRLYDPSRTCTPLKAVSIIDLLFDLLSIIFDFMPARSLRQTIAVVCGYLLLLHLSLGAVAFLGAAKIIGTVLIAYTSIALLLLFTIVLCLVSDNRSR